MISENIFLSTSTPSSLDPHSNTGSNSLDEASKGWGVTAHIDNLSLLWLGNGSKDIHWACRNYLGIEFDLSNPIGRKIGIWWDRCYSSCSGAIISERDGEGGKVYLRLSLSGESCGRVSNIRLRSFIHWCSQSLVGLTCSRIDLAIDDFSKHLNLNELQAACEDGNYAGFKECKATVNYGKKHNGWTMNLGARSGEKYIRIYDKFAESKGKINAIRFEAEISGKLSDKLFSMLLEFPKDEVEYQKELINYAVGTISFIEKLDKNLDRNMALGWWADWLVYLDCCPKKLHIRRFKTSINAKKRWIEKAVSKSLALLKDALGQVEMKRYMDLIIKEATQRYVQFDLMILEDYRSVNKYIEIGYDIVAI